ncbi:MAG: KpsF/GutQ family sugar-phosphate isomerase, partial [Desulfobulbaceae bacterium]|nr:KpsF/GutQ family sugar-phosphate isomerase [Desulfobulbaceae bacterium]
DLGMVSSSDVILAISYSGETGELNALLSTLQQRAVKIIAMTGNAQSTLATFADAVLNVGVPKEACPLGLAPTSSTTATLALGDALAVVLLNRKQFRAEDFRRNHPGGSLGERLKVAVSEVMLTAEDIPLVRQPTTFIAAIRELNEKSLGAVLIVSGDNGLQGILTDGDVRRVVSEGRDPAGIDLKKVMTSNPITIDKNIMAADALSVMQEKEITVLPVTDTKGRLLGILHLHDLLGKGEFRFLI